MNFIVTCVEQLFAISGVEDGLKLTITDLFWPFFNFMAVITIIFFLYMVPRIWRLLKNISWQIWLDLFIVTSLGLCLRLWLSPRCPQVYFDEICFGELAHNLRTLGHYSVTMENPSKEIIMPFLPAWPFCQAWLGRIFIWDYSALAYFCIFIGSLAIPLCYGVSYQLTRQRTTSLFLSLLVALWPVHLRISACGALENGSFTIFLMMALCLMLWNDGRDRAWLWATGLCWAWFADWRMENSFVLAPVFLVSLMIADPRYRTIYRNKDIYLVGLIAFIFALPGFICDIYGIYAKFYLTDVGSVQQATYLKSKIISNWLFWVNDNFHPLWFTWLAICGVGLLYRKLSVWAWVFWFIALNVFYGFIPTADFNVLYTYDSWRNSLFPTWGLLVLAAMGMNEIGLETKKLFPQAKWVVWGILVAILAGEPTCKSEFINARNTWMREFQFASSIGERLPQGAHLFISGNLGRIQGNSFLTNMWNTATGCRWLWYVLPDVSIYDNRSDCPVLLEASHNWIESGERVFVCISGYDEDSWDLYRWRWFEENYDMRLVAGEAVPYVGEFFYLYEIDGLTSNALESINRTRSKNER